MRIFATVKPRPNTIGLGFRDELIATLGEAFRRIDGPVILRVRFIFKRSADELAPAPIGEPSIFALARAVGDQLAGEAYSDERQVVALHVGKEYGNTDAIEVRW